MQAPDEIVDAFGWPAPVDHPVIFGQPVGVGGHRLVLRGLSGAAREERVNGCDEQRRSDAGQVALDLVARFVGTNRPPGRGQHRTGVERLDDPHDRHAGLILAGHDRAVDGRGAAVAWEQRRVNVDESLARHREYGVGQNPAVGGDNAEIRLDRLQVVEKDRIFQAFRLENRQTGCHRAHLHRSVARPVAAAARSIGLRDDADEAVARLEERVERGDRELRRAEEHDPEAGSLYHLPVRVSFRILRTMRSRLMPRSRSTKSIPSR
jgi:hypothetical protein